jgi:hypothetical protein
MIREALPVALGQIAAGAERLKIGRVIAATPDHGPDVVEVLGRGAADRAIVADDVRGP